MPKKTSSDIIAEAIRAHVANAATLTKGVLDFESPGFHSFEHKKATIDYHVIADADRIEIASLRVPHRHRKQGHATEAIEKFIQHADRSKKTIKLLASPLDKQTHLGKLIKFYQKQGFELTGKAGNSAGDPWMERKPSFRLK